MNEETNEILKGHFRESAEHHERIAKLHQTHADRLGTQHNGHQHHLDMASEHLKHADHLKLMAKNSYTQHDGIAGSEKASQADLAKSAGWTDTDMAETGL
jgi:hypothetical protein